MSQWNRLADEHGFIVVYPSGIGGAGPRVWRVGRGAGLTRDVRFISELIDTLEAAYNIDSDEDLCQRTLQWRRHGVRAFLHAVRSDRGGRDGGGGSIPAVELVYGPSTGADDCVSWDRRSDGSVPWRYSRGSPPDRFPDIPTWTANWARRNRCGPNPVESVVAADVTRLEYTNCADDAAVVLYTIQGGGHTWPGGEPLPEWFAGPTSRSIDATSQMWAFFREHRLLERGLMTAGTDS